MGVLGDFCFDWTLKKSAILFGCAELCDCGLFLSELIDVHFNQLSFWIVLFVLCLGIFVPYMYGILKVIST